MQKSETVLITASSKHQSSEQGTLQTMWQKWQKAKNLTTSPPLNIQASMTCIQWENMLINISSAQCFLAKDTIQILKVYKYFIKYIIIKSLCQSDAEQCIETIDCYKTI